MNSNQKILVSPHILCYIKFKVIVNVTDIVTGKVSGNIVQMYHSMESIRGRERGYGRRI